VKKEVERGGGASRTPLFYSPKRKEPAMIHQLQVHLYQLTDIKNEECSTVPLLAARGVAVGDFLCFECNDAKFPRSMRRWVYAQVTAQHLRKMERHGVEVRSFIDTTFELVANLSDVTLT
jgi:hypothetical protein